MTDREDPASGWVGPDTWGEDTDPDTGDDSHGASVEDDDLAPCEPDAGTDHDAEAGDRR